ncbi:MAG: hypothetical protein IMF16_00990 [Proteobacteria bacterium]|nr:hypothetical protein [Pseudomonadota bacterium]
MSEVSRCKFCGAFTEQDDKFCWSCGAAVEEERETPQARPTAESDPETDLRLRRVYLARKRGQWQEAETLVQEALTHDAESVPALTLLAEILRQKGDLVGAVEAAQRATDSAQLKGAMPGALRRAREERSQIQQQALRGVAGRVPGTSWNLISLLSMPGVTWYQSGRFYLLLTVLGVGGLFLALVSALRGHTLGYLWFAISLASAGWCYQDAETRGQSSLFWGPFVLCLGPFGLAIYLLSR